ncbi:MAG: glucose-1-phosphate thymidylyltransferase [Fimbriimonadia bacterium]
MRGLILSGGKGTRLRPITFSMAKQLVPVANKPVLFYGLEAMRDAGIEEVGIVVGETEPDIRAAVGDGSPWSLRVTYIRQDEPLGLAHAVKTARPYLADAPFLMYLGDNLIKSGVCDLVAEFERERPNATILLCRVPNPQDFGVAELDGEHVVRLEEKPKHPKSDLALVGVYLFDSSIHAVIDTLKPSARGELEITDAIQGLVERGGDVRSHIVSGWWKDTGTVEAILDANRVVLEDIQPLIAPSAEIGPDTSVSGALVVGEESVMLSVSVTGPVAIGAGCVLHDVSLGPNVSVGDGCRLEKCAVENSILMSGCRILGPGLTVRDSLIGSDVHVTGGQTNARLVLGDSSQVHLVD